MLRTNLPWFDAKVHKLCIKKERLRSQYKASLKPEHYDKFSAAHKELTNLVKRKMRSNFCDPFIVLTRLQKNSGRMLKAILAHQEFLPVFTA